MNAAKYLRAQGWRGEGHSLDHTNRGLAKPLLITRKLELAGLGTKKNDFSNQWWLGAWDSTPPSVPVPSSNSRLSGKGGLYSYFTKAETLAGTIVEKSSPPTTMAQAPNGNDNDSVVGKKRQRSEASDAKKPKKLKVRSDAQDIGGKDLQDTDADSATIPAQDTEAPSMAGKTTTKKLKKSKSAEAIEGAAGPGRIPSQDRTKDKTSSSECIVAEPSTVDEFLLNADEIKFDSQPPQDAATPADDPQTLRKKAARARRVADMERFRRERKEHKKEKKAKHAAEKEATAARLKLTREKKQIKYKREKQKREAKRQALALNPEAAAEAQKVKAETKKKSAERRAAKAAMKEERAKAKVERKAKRKADKKAKKVAAEAAGNK